MRSRQQSYLSLVTDSEIESIRNTAMKILCHSGFRFENETILEMLGKKGLKVDYTKEAVEITPEVFARVEQCAARSGRKSKTEIETIVRRSPSKGFSLGRNIVQIHEWDTGVRRHAVLEDNIRFMKAARMLPEITCAAPIYTSSDVPYIIEPIIGVASAIKISEKPLGGIEMMMGEQLPYLQELETIKAGYEVKYTSSFASLTRFSLDRRAASCLEAVWRNNGLKEWGTNSCAFTGLNAPVTAAGAAAMAMAEIIGGWLAGWALNEDLHLHAIPVTGTIDMRSTRTMFSTPKAILIDAILFQVFDKLYGVDTAPECTATYVDGKMPGMQLLHDKVLKTMALFSYTGCNTGVHFGMIEAGTAICPAQLILDLELNNELEQLTQGIYVNDDTLALDTILEAGVHGDFISTDHTLSNYKESLWHPELLDCTAFSGQKEELGKEQAVLEKAQVKFDSAVSRYQPIDISDDVIRAVDKVVARAEKELLK